MGKKFLLVMILFLLVALGACSNESSTGEGGGFPTKDITLTVPFSAGDTTDLISRTFADFASERLGQNIVVVNKEGAGGSIGHSEVARENPDGYNILLGSSGALTVSPYMREVGYTYEDFDPIGLLVENAIVIVTHKDSELNSFDDLVTYAKDNPGDIEYATPGAGVAQHIMMERMSKEFGFEATHIPHEGGNNAVAAALGQHVDVAIVGANLVGDQVQSGELKALGVSVEDANLPDIETFADQGYEMDATVWFGLFVPKGTPENIKEVLTETLKAASEDEEVIQSFNTLKVNHNFLAPDELLEKLDENVTANQAIIEEIGLGGN